MLWSKYEVLMAKVGHKYKGKRRSREREHFKFKFGNLSLIYVKTPSSTFD